MNRNAAFAERTPRWWLDRYGVHAAVLVVALVALVVAPSHQPRGLATAGRQGDLGAEGSGRTSGSDGTGTMAGSADATIDSATGQPAAGTASDQPGRAAPGAAGLQVTGEDCARTKVLGPAWGCMPLSSGTNSSGATAKGVKANTITIVIYKLKSDDQVDAVIGGQSDYSTDPAVYDDMVRGYAAWASRHFQTWGRKVEVKIFQSEAADASASRAEATRIDEELNAFLVAGALDLDFIDEVTRRGVICICGFQLLQKFHTDRAPFVWNAQPSADITNAHIAEFISKKLGPTADHGGDGVKGKPRTYGILYNTQLTKASADDLETRLAAAGIPVRAKIGYQSDINTAAQQATNVASQLKQAGITTVLCVCDPIAPFFLYAALDTQAYYPEHFQTAYLYQDAFEAAQFYSNTSQQERNFGISWLPLRLKTEDDPAFQVYRQETKRSEIPLGFGAAFLTISLVHLGMERAGPVLTPDTFEAGMFTVDLPSRGPFETTIDFDPGDYTGASDFQQVWWDKDATAGNGAKGDFRNVNGGKRYRAGTWPTTRELAFRPDCLGSGTCGEGS